MANGFEHRFLWTWDHSTNWTDPPAAIQETGAANPYLKDARIFVEDYTRLLDHMRELDLNGLIVWGLLRDSHGGIKAAARILERGRRNGVRILAGIGVNAYGGIYYEGRHPFNIRAYLKRRPRLAAVGPDGKRKADLLCPSRDENLAWYLKGMDWLFDALDLGGVNLETGDYGLCHCRECRARRQRRGDADPAAAFSVEDIGGFLRPVCERIRKRAPACLITFATYIPPAGPACEKLALYLREFPDDVVPQWTLTSLIDPGPRTPLSPRERERGREVLAGLPQKAQVGFFHQGSQWHRNSRHEPVLRSMESAVALGKNLGLSGLITHGEVSNRDPAWLLNYLAFSRFTRTGRADHGVLAKALDRFVGGLGEEYLSYLFAGDTRRPIAKALARIRARRFLTRFPPRTQEHLLWWWLENELARRLHLLSEWGT